MPPLQCRTGNLHNPGQRLQRVFQISFETVKTSYLLLVFWMMKDFVWRLKVHREVSKDELELQSKLRM